MSGFKPGDSSFADPQQSLWLFRRLLSLIEAPRTEAELIPFVVDALFRQFPDFRCSFANVGTDGFFSVVYSRQPAPMEPLSGKTRKVSALPWFLGPLLKHQRVVFSDIHGDPALGTAEERAVAFAGTAARVDIPIDESDGKVSVLSLAHLAPQVWDQSVVDLLSEAGALVRIILREARAQAKLKRSEMVFRQFAENVQVVFWMTDTTKMELVYVSPAYETIWGRSTQSLYQQPLSFIDAIHPDDRERVRAAILRQTDEEYEQQYRVVQPNGAIRWVKDRGFHVRDDAGKVHRIAGIAEDITEILQAQEYLVATQLRVMSNSKFAALGEMASGIAHEINNPLAVIHGLTVQLKKRLQIVSLPAPVLDNLETVERMANRIAVIVKGLRVFSRQTASDPMLPADLISIIQETMAMCDAKFKEANVEVKTSFPAADLWIDCRSSEISQVILNLVSNAYDAVLGTSHRLIKIDVGTEDEIVRVSVEDNGQGVPPELRERIFQPFFTTKDVGRGTGLGLSISKGITEAHGGKLFLDLDSRSTRFVLEIPLKAESV